MKNTKKFILLLFIIMLSFFVTPNKVHANTYLCKYPTGGVLVSPILVADDDTETIYVCKSLVAWSIFTKDVDYLVVNGGCSPITGTNIVTRADIISNKCPQNIWYDPTQNILCSGKGTDGCKYLATANYTWKQETTNQVFTGKESLIIGYFGGPESFGKLVYADSLFATSNCPSEEPVFKMISYFYSLLKIIVPVVLVLFGSIDIAKAVAASDDGAIKKATSSFLRKLVAGVIVFLLFEIVGFVINLVSENYGVMDCVNKIIGN